MEDFIMNELVCLRATEPLGSDRYNELSKAINWVEGHRSKVAKPMEAKKHNYAHTIIEWKDDGQREEAIISMCGYDAKYDGLITFYCDSEADFEKLKHYENGEDFVVVGCTMYTEDLD